VFPSNDNGVRDETEILAGGGRKVQSLSEQWGTGEEKKPGLKQ